MAGQEMIVLGASDAPAVVDVDLHGITPWQLWARLVGLLPPSAETPAMAWGRRLEPVIVRAIAEEVEAGGYEVAETRYHPHRPWQRATPDALLHLSGGERWLAEAKALRGPAPEEPQLAWLVQCQHQLMVWPEMAGVCLGAMGQLDCRVWRVTPHAELQRVLLEREERFLALVESQTPPPVQGADNEWLARAYPRSATMQTVRLGPEAIAWDAARQRGKSKMKEGQTEVDEAEANLKHAIGEARAGVLTDGTVYQWATTARKGYTVEAATVRTLRRKGVAGNGD